MKTMKKLKSQQGFSVSEMLMAVLVIMLTLSFIGGGITVIKDAYIRITLRAEAQTLLSTVITSVSNELRNTSEIQKIEETSGNSYWSFYNFERGYRMYFENKNDNIYIKTEVLSEEIPLLTQKTITKGLVPKLEDLTYENQVFTYTIKIYYKDEVYAEQEISIRPMNAD